tara:strand:+ start:102 stop:269 length:168 start_codon:yes stop_codon:yes gene_type:complete
MKYAIVQQVGESLFLKGFTNTAMLFGEENAEYTVKLTEMSSLSVRLTGNARVYLS